MDRIAPNGAPGKKTDSTSAESAMDLIDSPVFTGEDVCLLDGEVSR